MLPCLDCREPTRQLRCDGVVVDRCAACGGIWFDEAELGSFREGLEKRDLDAGLNPPPLPRAPVDGPRHCPRCAVGLVGGAYAYGTGVHVARCPRCEGVWLAGVEVLRLIAYLRTLKNKRPEIRAVADEIAEGTRARQRMERWYRGYGFYDWTYGVADALMEYFPLRADNDGAATPKATWTFLIVGIVSLFLTPSALRGLSVVPAELVEGKVFFGLWASSLLYADRWRLAFEAYFLFVFGAAVERELGTARFVMLFFGAHGAAILAWLLVVGTSSNAAFFGGTAAIGAVVAAYVTLHPDGRVRVAERRRTSVPALALALLFVGGQWAFARGSDARIVAAIGLVVGLGYGLRERAREA